MKRKYPKIIRNRKARIERRLDPKQTQGPRDQPMMEPANLDFEMAERTRAVSCGGLGAIHLLVQKLGLAKDIDRRVQLLKRHLPFHESDHVLSLAYNALLGGVRLEDIDLRRNDETYLDAINAQRIPDPTTSGDFTRRFSEPSIRELLEAINDTRRRVWKLQPKGFLQEAWIDIDGTIAGTLGECKGGMALSYKGIWGYHPLVISLANTKEVLYLVNRPGNVVSHEGCAPWIDEAINLVKEHAGQITLRGDTDFTLTGELDRWQEQGVKFLFGMDAHVKVKGLAEALPETDWSVLERLPKYEIKTEPRQKPENIKEAIVVLKGYTNQVLVGESVAEIAYQPLKCARRYRLVIVRKNLSVRKGEAALLDEIRYFFYLTNRTDLSAAEVVALANGRGDQENVIEQLKNGVNALRMPVNDLLSNWAYMVMTSLAWNLKAWFGLLVPDRQRGLELVGMEFRRFLHSIILLPAQIVRTARRLIFRFLGYNDWFEDLFATVTRIRQLGAP